VIPDAAIEAAAERVYGAVTGNAWAVADDAEKADAKLRARWILEAAAPHMLMSGDEGWTRQNKQNALGEWQEGASG